MSRYGKLLLSSAYFPPVDYFAAIINSDSPYIEQFETYQKQSYRTRCHIYGGNGLLVLTIPIKKVITHKLPIREITIDYSSSWLKQHCAAIVSAYNNSPFFEYYFYDEFLPILEKREHFLFDLNLSLTQRALELISTNKKIALTDSFIGDDLALQSDNILDLRDRIHPKRESRILEELELENQYYQVFNSKYGFLKNLSILDLLFNEGPNSITYLEKVISLR